jgi:hypothetical protein
MRIIRVYNPRGVDLMKNVFLQNEDYPEGVLGEMVKKGLEDFPNSIYLLHAWDADKLKAFILAWDVVGQNHVFLEQAWADPNTEKNILDQMFTSLMVWASSLNKQNIRAEVTQHTEAIIRRWKFKKHSEILSFSVGDIFSKMAELAENDTLDMKISSEIKDGQQLETESSAGKQADSGASEVRADVGGSSGEEVGRGLPVVD